jgi:hypothetical protein
LQSSLTFVSGLPIQAIASRTFAGVIVNGRPPALVSFAEVLPRARTSLVGMAGRQTASRTWLNTAIRNSKACAGESPPWVQVNCREVGQAKSGGLVAPTPGVRLVGRAR